MHLTVFGANSITGRHLVEQALTKNWSVTAFDRDIRFFIDKDLRTEKLHAMKGYVFDARNVSEALEHADAVVSLLGGGTDGIDHSRSLGSKNIIQQMQSVGVKRIVALGGYGVLDAGGRYVLDTPDYPASLHALAEEQLLMLRFLEVSTLDWTLICPADILDEDGTRNYVTTAHRLPASNTHEIAAGDLADFILQELSTAAHLKQCVAITRR
jgi:putative NADH-flavin reductase